MVGRATLSHRERLMFRKFVALQDTANILHITLTTLKKNQKHLSKNVKCKSTNKIILYYFVTLNLACEIIKMWNWISFNSKEITKDEHWQINDNLRKTKILIKWFYNAHILCDISNNLTSSRIYNLTKVKCNKVHACTVFSVRNYVCPV